VCPKNKERWGIQQGELLCLRGGGKREKKLKGERVGGGVVQDFWALIGIKKTVFWREGDGVGESRVLGLIHQGDKGTGGKAKRGLRTAVWGKTTGNTWGKNENVEEGESGRGGLSQARV